MITAAEAKRLNSRPDLQPAFEISLNFINELVSPNYLSTFNSNRKERLNATVSKTMPDGGKCFISDANLNNLKEYGYHIIENDLEYNIIWDDTHYRFLLAQTEKNAL